MPEIRMVSLPEDLCAEAEERFKERFENVEALLRFVLQEITNPDADRLDENEERILEQRLRDLGYV
jgi:hypothetical protein